MPRVQSTLMARSPTPRVFVRRILGRDRLEITEQETRQAQALIGAQHDRLAALEAEVRAVSATVNALSGAVDRLHDTLAVADPVGSRVIVDALRSDVGDLVVTINRLLGERAASVAQG